ncbi:hypothetical protein ScPMuIL_002933 [Solemya velum]
MDLLNVLETYRGRDKIIRTCSYLATMFGASGNSATAKKLQTIAAELSACRVMLRLFDDLPMLAHNLSYGLGSKEKITLMQILEMGINAANQLYYPLEHVAWLADKSILNFKSQKWWIAGLIVWGVSLFLGVIRNTLRIIFLRRAEVNLKKQEYLDNSKEKTETSEQNQTIQGKLRKLKMEEKDCYFAVIQNMADLLNAINWLPFKFLWAGKIDRSKGGFFGLISSIIMLYRLWPEKHRPKVS